MAGTATSGRAAAVIERERDYREELTARQAEDVDFALRVRTGATRLLAAAVAGRRDVVANEAGKLGYYADRRLRQLGSVVL